MQIDRPSASKVDYGYGYGYGISKAANAADAHQA